MAYIIAEPCIGTCDTACVDVCPVDCIHPTMDTWGDKGIDPDNLAGKMLYIDPEECIDCAACEPECPVSAIFEEDDLPEEWEHFIEINAEYFKSGQEYDASKHAQPGLTK